MKKLLTLQALCDVVERSRTVFFMAKTTSLEIFDMYFVDFCVFIEKGKLADG
jgi:hypothetical protein